MDKDQRLRLILVEDDQGHAVLIEKNLRRAGLASEIVRFANGQEALDYIFGTIVGSGDEPVVPCVILLDLNLPEVDGCQVLQQLKSDPKTRRIPVVVLTTTENPHEIKRCYDLGCNAYISKPVEYDQFSAVIKSLGQFLGYLKVP